MVVENHPWLIKMVSIGDVHYSGLGMGSLNTLKSLENLVMASDGPINLCTP